MPSFQVHCFITLSSVLRSQRQITILFHIFHSHFIQKMNLLHLVYFGFSLCPEQVIQGFASLRVFQRKSKRGWDKARDRNKWKGESVRGHVTVCFMPLLLSCSSQTVCSITRSIRAEGENMHAHTYNHTQTVSVCYHQLQSTAKHWTLLCLCCIKAAIVVVKWHQY